MYNKGGLLSLHLHDYVCYDVHHVVHGYASLFSFSYNFLAFIRNSFLFCWFFLHFLSWYKCNKTSVSVELIQSAVEVLRTSFGKIAPPKKRVGFFDLGFRSCDNHFDANTNYARWSWQGRWIWSSIEPVASFSIDFFAQNQFKMIHTLHSAYRTMFCIKNKNGK